MANIESWLRPCGKASPFFLTHGQELRMSCLGSEIAAGGNESLEWGARICDFFRRERRQNESMWQQRSVWQQELPSSTNAHHLGHARVSITTHHTSRYISNCARRLSCLIIHDACCFLLMRLEVKGREVKGWTNGWDMRVSLKSNFNYALISSVTSPHKAMTVSAISSSHSTRLNFKWTCRRCLQFEPNTVCEKINHINQIYYEYSWISWLEYT